MNGIGTQYKTRCPFSGVSQPGQRSHGKRSTVTTRHPEERSQRVIQISGRLCLDLGARQEALERRQGGR
jgi:hypothetical protein